MKTLFRTFAALTALTICSSASSAKEFDMQWWMKNSKDYNQLRNGDSFSVECRNERTGVIDRESVDVDLATVTVEIPGSAPVVHHIIEFGMEGNQIQDRFGQFGMEIHVAFALWGKIGAHGFGLFLAEGRWHSRHEDDTFWTCANY